MGSNPTRPASNFASSSRTERVNNQRESDQSIEDGSREPDHAPVPAERTTNQFDKDPDQPSIVARMRQDPDLDRWWHDLYRGSLNTADVWMRRLNNFCRETSTTPNQIALMNERETHKLRIDVVTIYEQKRDKKGLPLAPGYIGGIVNVAVPNWIHAMTGRTEDPVNITNEGEKKRTELIPTPRLVNKVWSAADLKAKVCVSIMAYNGGCREQVLGNAEGTDGIVLCDFPELILDEDEIRFTVKNAHANYPKADLEKQATILHVHRAHPCC